jgi:hypothetical protein
MYIYSVVIYPVFKSNSDVIYSVVSFWSSYILTTTVREPTEKIKKTETDQDQGESNPFQLMMMRERIGLIREDERSNTTHNSRHPQTIIEDGEKKGSRKRTVCTSIRTPWCMIIF